MSITNDADSSGPSSPLAHATANQPDRVLIVSIVLIGSTTARTVSSVTYNSVSMSLIDAVGTSDGDNSRVEFWKLVAPATGTHDIAYTLSGAFDGAEFVGGTTWYGVDQSTVNRTASKNTFGTDASHQSDTLTPTSSVGDIVIDCMGFRYSGQGTVTLGGSQTQIWSQNSVSHIGSYKAGAAGTTTMTISWATDDWTPASYVAFALIPVAAAGGKPASYYQMMRSA